MTPSAARHKRTKACSNGVHITDCILLLVLAADLIFVSAARPYGYPLESLDSPDLIEAFEAKFVGKVEDYGPIITTTGRSMLEDGDDDMVRMDSSASSSSSTSSSTTTPPRRHAQAHISRFAFSDS